MHLLLTIVQDFRLENGGKAFLREYLKQLY